MMKLYYGAPLAFMQSNTQLTHEQTVKFVAGLFHGFTGNDDYKTMIGCMNHLDDLTDQFSTAYSKLQGSNIVDIVFGAEDFDEFLVEIPADMVTCPTLAGDMATVTSWGTDLLNPLVLIPRMLVNLPVNFDKIFNDFLDFGSSFQGENFFDAGDKISEIIVLSVGKPKARDEFAMEMGLMMLESLFPAPTPDMVYGSLY